MHPRPLLLLLGRLVRLPLHGGVLQPGLLPAGLQEVLLQTLELARLLSEQRLQISVTNMLLLLLVVSAWELEHLRTLPATARVWGGRLGVT